MSWNFAGNSTAVQLLASASCANTSAATGSWVDVREYDGPVVVTQNAGTGTGTLDGKLQEASDSGGTGAADISGATFTQKTTTANSQKLVFNPRSTLGWVRYVGTIGTGPQVVGVSMIGRKKISP